MTNLKDVEKQVAIGDSRTLTGTKHGDWHSYQRREGKHHHMTSSNMFVILGLYANLFSMTRAIQKGFQVKLEGETLILGVILTDICFDEKMANKSG